MSTPPPPTSPPSAQRGDAGAILLGLGALLLFISLFLHWYRPGRTAWTVFEVWDLVLCGLALAAVLGALGRLGIARERSERWVTVPSAGAFVIVVLSLLNHPPAAGGGPMIGIWLALFASIVMLAGVATSMARISLVIEMTERSHGARSAPGAAPRLGLGRLRRRGGAKRPGAGATAPPKVATEPPSSPSSSTTPRPPPSPPTPPSRRPAASESPLFGAAPDEPESPRSIPPRGVSDPAEEPTQAHTHGGSANDPDAPAAKDAAAAHEEPGDPSAVPAPDDP
jgi:hypothetical protein